MLFFDGPIASLSASVWIDRPLETTPVVAGKLKAQLSELLPELKRHRRDKSQSSSESNGTEPGQ